MHIAMIGSGYVGLVSGACLADFGHSVICVDKDAEKISALQQGECPIFESGLADLIRGNTHAGRLSFTSELRNAVAAILQQLLLAYRPRTTETFRAYERVIK
jgi:UDPglucose 6-dehydrogenase